MRNGLSCSEAGRIGAEKTNEIRRQNKEKTIEAYYLNPNKCSNCESDLVFKKRNNKFCCKSCAAIYNNKRRVKKELNKCVWCGGECKSVYCSHFCQRDYKRALKLNIWLLTNEGKPIRDYIIKQQLGKCNHCGIYEWNNKQIILELEHKDGNSGNNHRDNLEMICPNCHSQTPTYKAKNKGNGRSKRRERYKEGKSY